MRPTVSLEGYRWEDAQTGARIPEVMLCSVNPCSVWLCPEISTHGYATRSAAALLVADSLSPKAIPQY